MRIFFRIYEKSALATLCSIAGGLCAVYSAYGLITDLTNKKFSDIILWIILIAIGVAMFILSAKVNKLVVERKVKKSLADTRLIAYIQQSTLAAYSLFKNDPTSDMLSYIGRYNAHAFNVIQQHLHGTITEEVLVNTLTQYDTLNSSIGIWPADKSYLYKNQMFTLYRVVIRTNDNIKMLEKLKKKDETKRTLKILGITFGIFAALMLFFFIALSNTGSGNNNKTCNHSYTSTVVYDATYYSDGLVTKRCTKCYHEITESIPKLESPVAMNFTSMETYIEEKEPLDLGDGTEIPMLDVAWIILDMTIENTANQDIESFSGYVVINYSGYESRIFILYNEGLDAGDSLRLSDYAFQANSATDRMLLHKSIDEVEITFELSNVTFREN